MVDDACFRQRTGPSSETSFQGRGKHETMPILVKVGIGIFLTKTPRYFEKGNVADKHGS
jgi:hypothetical protein